jgi:hypothetical protein
LTDAATGKQQIIKKLAVSSTVLAEAALPWN